ncbi:MAG: hypothetical protein ACFFCS_01010 [Candidatus Hodarchaeota archaeon]
MSSSPSSISGPAREILSRKLKGITTTFNARRPMNGWYCRDDNLLIRRESQDGPFLVVQSCTHDLLSFRDRLSMTFRSYPRFDTRAFHSLRMESILERQFTRGILAFQARGYPRYSFSLSTPFDTDK